MVSALIPLSVSAAVPQNVTQVEAHRTGNGMTVSWTSPQGGTDIGSYRVYVSHESILDHDGNYDDSVQTPDNKTVYVFNTLPLQSQKIYVAILAVSKEGEESEGFESETSIDSGVAPSSASSSSLSAAPAPMAVVEVKAVSGTGVLITFSKSITEPTPLEARFFAIVDASGSGLAITAIEVIDQTILLHTAMHEPDKNYSLAILEPISANDGTSFAVQSDKFPFTGFHNLMGAPQASSVSSSAPADVPYVSNPDLPPAPEENLGPPEDPVNLALKAMRRADGTYTVVAEWGASADSRHTLTSYSLATTKDGAMLNPNLVVASNRTSVKYDSVPAGVFGVKVSSKDEKGNESVGIQKVITLPNSGVGLLGIATVSGLITGRKKLRRRK